MPTYTHVATYDAPVEDVWAWYDSPGAFRRIMPEWEGIKPLEAGRLVNDATTRFRVSLGPLRPMWVARHYDVVAGEVFNDVMEKVPSVLGTTNIALFQRATTPAKFATPSSGNCRSIR